MDIVRIPDCRMSGTASGAIVVVHVSTEAAAGGSLTLARDGDEVDLDIETRHLEPVVSEEDLAVRRSEWRQPSKVERGYVHPYQEHVLQAGDGCDLDFLRKV